MKYSTNSSHSTGLSSVSGFSNHAQTVDDLEFKDNGYGEQDNFTQTDYSYPVPGKILDIQ